jgi:xylose isomerase
MDAFARGLEIAWASLEDGRLQELVDARYAGWQTEFGQKIMEGVKTLADCEDHVLRHGEPVRASGRQEYVENLINEFIL